MGWLGCDIHSEPCDTYAKPERYACLALVFGGYEIFECDQTQISRYARAAVVVVLYV